MTVPGRGLVAVVLAGGESRRFGSDKLAAPVSGTSLLDQALAGLPASAPVFVVGPRRPLARPALFVREDPPGGGPAAGMVTGLRAALDSGAEEILVLPGDAPGAGSAAVLLWRSLVETGAAAVVGTDSSGFEQPLQLALRRPAALALVEAAGPGGGHGGSARALVDRLDPAAVRCPLPAVTSFDIDTPEQLQVWTARTGAAVEAVLAAVDELSEVERPVVVALDGRSGAGTETLAAAVSLARSAAVLHTGDFGSAELTGLDFFQRERLTDAQVAERALSWRQLAGRVDTFAGDLLVVEGVYSGRPELSGLVDLAVFVDVDEGLRRRRLAGREREDPHLLSFAERGESYYFAVVRPPDSYDLVVTSVED